MPIQHELDRHERLIRTTVSGPVTLADVRQYVGDVRRAGKHSVPELIDARNVEPAGLSARDMLAVAHFARRTFDDHNVARRAVIVKDDSTFGIARTFSSLVAGWLRLGVFDDQTDAETWLRQA
ncbi:MAG TPA: STAS/SEC14 domain-containing protein [Vicinamibacterales bacterium]|nr:STAS/SEC14 domain-containing protein [Vicinamibacterales bacterium]